MSTVRELLKAGTKHLHGTAAPAIETKVLLMQATGLSEVEFLSSPDKTIRPKDEQKFRRLVQKRLSGVPLAYILYRKEFWSLPLRIEPGVFIPRPETELLVEKTLELAAGRGVTVADIGTGSGNIALALATELPRARIFATDVSARAIRVARRNAQDHGIKNVTFAQGSLFSALFGLGLEGRCDFIVCNPPYVSAADWASLPREIRDHEPRRAFLGGKTGLDFIRRLIKGAPAFLKPGAHLLFEVGYDQAGTVVSWLKPAWSAVESFSDLRGIKRVVKARRA